MLAAEIPSRTAAPRVLLAGKLDAWLAPGGGEIQLQAMTAALNAAGISARPWRPWEDRLERAGWLHLFGSRREHVELIAAARRAGVKVAVSPIAWFDLASYWRQGGSVVRRLAACGRFVARAACPAIPSWRRTLYGEADLLLPNSQVEADQLRRYFGVPAKKIRVVPNGADARFAAGDPLPASRLVGASGFVLYAGRIEPRKNQLGFLRAMRGTDVPIVVLGDTVPGHEGYLSACHRAAGPNVKFVDRVEHDSPLLASAYAACGCLVLASWFETPGLVALEAGMSGTPLVLPEGGSAREYFGELAAYVAPGDRKGIRRAVLAALGRERSAALAQRVQERYSWQAAAEATRNAYESIP